MALPRPLAAPKKIPLWAWHLTAWLSAGKQGKRPKGAPKRPPSWFWTWRLWRLAIAQGKGSKAWKRYLAKVKPAPKPKPALNADRAAVAKLARWGAAHEPQIHYSESTVRDDWLFAGVKPPKLPLTTDCSGFATLCYWAAGLPDPNGLDYKWLGYTGTLLDNAARNGRILSDVSNALPGDTIVMGPGTGAHVVVCVESGTDPLVVSHGQESGPVIQRLSVDTREPKRVCQVLPA